MTTPPIVHRTVRTQADLERTWRDLMEPLGFAAASLWVLLIDADGHPTPLLTKVEECDGVPTAAEADGFAQCYRGVLEADVPGGRLAVLRTRPGRGGPDAHDLLWAHAIYRACRRAGVPTEVVHMASGDTLAPIPLDALHAA